VHLVACLKRVQKVIPLNVNMPTSLNRQIRAIKLDIVLLGSGCNRHEHSLSIIPIDISGRRKIKVGIYNDFQLRRQKYRLKSQYAPKKDAISPATLKHTYVIIFEISPVHTKGATAVNNQPGAAIPDFLLNIGNYGRKFLDVVVGKPQSLQ
jgi:hypothetical protein